MKVRPATQGGCHEDMMRPEHALPNREGFFDQRLRVRKTPEGNAVPGVAIENGGLQELGTIGGEGTGADVPSVGATKVRHRVIELRDQEQRSRNLRRRPTK